MSAHRNRQPAGSPVGGQFSTTARPEGDLELPAGDVVVEANHPVGGAAQVFVGDDGALVVQIDTADLPEGTQVRVHLNDGALYEGDPERDDPPGPGVLAAQAQAHAALVELLTPEPQWSPDGDERAMDAIAMRLGRDGDWSKADYCLNDIADRIADTGRPHPGYLGTGEYEDALQRHIDGRDGTGGDTTRRLDALARDLGTNVEWDNIDPSDIADVVASTGRPHPGEVNGGPFLVALALAAAERADSRQAAQAEVAEGMIEWMHRVDADGVVSLGHGNAISFTARPDAADPTRFDRRLTVRMMRGRPGGGVMEEDVEVDLAGTDAEALLDALAAQHPKRGPLTEYVR